MVGGLYTKAGLITHPDPSPLNFQVARFLTSAATLAQCPGDQGGEVAFCGRSNAGKSSALNALTSQGNLARTSKTPGRTRLLNFFSLDEHRRLVDLPGHGYAKVATSVQQHWQQHLDHYLRHRQCLQGLVLLMDIRHPLRAFDQMMIDWSLSSDLPLHILLTKADKMKPGAQHASLQSVTAKLPADISVQLFSSTKKIGIRCLAARISIWLGSSSQQGE